MMDPRAQFPGENARPGQSAFAQFTAQQSPSLIMANGPPGGANGYPFDPYGGNSFAKGGGAPYGLRGNVPKPLGDSSASRALRFNYAAANPLRTANRFSGLRLEDLQGGACTHVLQPAM
jgi:hypothetical protein